MTLIVSTIFTWLGLISLAFCLAVLVFRLPFFFEATHDIAHQDIFSPGIWRLFGLGLAIIAVSSIAELVFRASEMSGTPIEAVLPALPVVLLRSHYGTVWIVRIAGLILLLAAMSLPARPRDSKPARFVMLLVAVIIIGTESASGHASDEGDFNVKETMDTLHLLAACAWGGGVLVLSLLIIPSFARRGAIAALARVSKSFSSMAGYAVAVLTATAIYNVWAYVGEFESLWKTTYGITVIVKMVLLYFLLLLGAFNRYVSVPLLQHVAGSRITGIGFIAHVAATIFDHFRGQLSGSIARVFRRAVLLEALLMGAILLAAALLRHETPARHLRHMEHKRMVQLVEKNCPSVAFR